MKLYLSLILAITFLFGCKARPVEKKSASQDINSNVNHYIEGFKQMRAGEIPLAIKNFEKHLETNPTDIRTHVTLANLYIRVKKDQEAEKILKKAIKIEPKNPDVYFLLTKCNIKSKNYKEAQQNIKLAIDNYSLENNSFGYQKALTVLKLINEKIQE